MATALETTVTLGNGVDIPQLGLGVFRTPAGEVTEQAVRQALHIGYRHIDTARIYGNEEAVGRALKLSGVDRESVFVTTKLWNTDHGYDAAIAACRASLRELDLEWIDLYLIHWPVQGLRLETWRAMEALLDEGHVRAAGVSNYMVRHLEELLGACRVPPGVNQIELSPYNYLHRLETVDLCRRHGITIEAYSPLTKGRKLDDPRLAEMAGRYGKTPAQILIRWGLEQGFVVIPKSSRPERLRENADVFDFTITNDDMEILEAFDEGLVTGWDPTDAP